MKTITKLSLLLAIMLTSFAGAFGQLHTLHIKGVVTTLVDRANLTGSGISLGDTLTGTISYLMNSTDQNDSPAAADYWSTDSRAGFNLKINDLVFGSDPSNVSFLTETLNDFFTQYEDTSLYEDHIVFHSYNNTFPSGLPWFEENVISFQLDDFTGTALNNTDIPLSINLASWTQQFGLTIQAYHWSYRPDSSLFIRVRITSIENQTYNKEYNSVDENALTGNFSVSPNPVNNSTCIKFGNIVNNGNVVIYNLFGQEVKTLNNVTGDNITITRNGLAAGAYYVRITENGREVSSGKFNVVD